MDGATRVVILLVDCFLPFLATEEPGWFWGGRAFPEASLIVLCLALESEEALETPA